MLLVNFRSPLFQEISYLVSVDFAQHLDPYENVVYLHSARRHNELGRFSFIAIDPFKKYTINKDNLNDAKAILLQIDNDLVNLSLRNHPELPPFQGGLAGYISYDLVRAFEKLPELNRLEIPSPYFAAALYDLVLAIDHVEKKAWIISTGFPEEQEHNRILRAQHRLDFFSREIHKPQKLPRVSFTPLRKSQIKSNFSKPMYINAVNKVKNHIRNGDIFQANLSQRFIASLPQDIHAFSLFRRLQHYNPAPFASYINLDDVKIVSSSPERFIKISEQQIETRPIKGTIKRALNKNEDRALSEQLLTSEKDRAENAMIVDLMRNDLSKICAPGSIQVTQFCGLETFATLHHLVSVITGKLESQIQFSHLLRALIPGGSITGAPKIRAMEIIEELESVPRGAYCGNAFYYGFNGAFDSSILIRTFVIFKNLISLHAGGAITLDSDPLQEYEETLAKAESLINTLTASFHVTTVSEACNDINA
jgi:para-aminobenzoate synthetase component I